MAHALLWSGEVRGGGFAVSVDVDRKRVNQTVYDGMDVNVSQWDSRTQLKSGLPPWGGGGGVVGVDMHP